MKIKLLINILIFILPVLAHGETVYKSRDAEGNIIFSDIPSEDAEVIEIEEAQTINIPQPDRSKVRPTTKLSPKEINYTKLVIIQPENDATIRSNAGTVDIKAEIAPELNEQHVIVFLLDGEEVGSGQSLQLSLTELDRGTHSVSVLVKNEKNKIVKRSGKQVFHLHKESILNKNKEKNIQDKNPSTPATSPLVPPL